MGRTARRSRLLYISATPLVPSKLGPARRNYHLVGQLTRFFDTFVLGPGAPGDAETIQSSLGQQLSGIVLVPSRQPWPVKFTWKTWRTITGRCDFLPALDPALRAACVATVARHSFDAVVLSSVFLRSLPLPSDLPTIADTHNVEFDVHRRVAASADSAFRRLYALCQCGPTRREEARCAAQVDLLLATSHRDAQLFENELNLRNVAVVPNGIDLAEFRARVTRSREPVILFSGLMSYYPNQHGIRWFMDAVLPIVLQRVPDAKLIVAGAAPPGWLLARRKAHIDVTGQVHDMRPFIAAATVVIAPLTIAGGTRVKILEAQAMARPVVSTSVGAEGLAQRDRDSILIGDDAPAFAEQVVRVLTEPAEAERIARNGRRHVMRLFDWDRIGAELGGLLQARLGLSGGAPVPSTQTQPEDRRAHRLPLLRHDRAV